MRRWHRPASTSCRPSCSTRRMRARAAGPMRPGQSSKRRRFASSNATRPISPQRITASELLTPADIEREFHITGGHWHHGELTLDQFLFVRPVCGAAQYRMPVDGLYLCGAGAHPGGGVSGAAGRNAARAILSGRKQHERYRKSARAACGRRFTRAWRQLDTLNTWHNWKGYTDARRTVLRRDRVFRDPQCDRRVRSHADDQVPHHGPRFARLHQPPRDARHGKDQARPRRLRGVVRRPRPGDRRRHDFSPARGRVPAVLAGAALRLAA